MTEPKTAYALLAIGVTLASGGAPARASDEPLLVVVEATPALEVDAGEVRRAVGKELHARTLAPIKSGEDPPDRALIVAVDQSRIAVSLRTSGGPAVVRAIPTPPDHAARLQAIAWLAGNLARDQVNPMLAETLIQPPPPDPAPPAPPALIEPPPLAPQPVAAVPGPDLQAGTPVVTVAHEPIRATAAHWTLGASLGPVVAVLDSPPNGVWPPALASHSTTAWQLEVLRRREGEQVILGAALEGTYGDSLQGPLYPRSSAPQLIGAHAFAGKEWRRRSLALEVTAGLGLEAAQGLNPSDYSPVSYYATYKLGPYAQGAVAGTVCVAGSMDLVVRLAVHLTMSRDENWFGASMLGVRWRLP